MSQTGQDQVKPFAYSKSLWGFPDCLGLVFPTVGNLVFGSDVQKISCPDLPRGTNVEISNRVSLISNGIGFVGA